MFKMTTVEAGANLVQDSQSSISWTIPDSVNISSNFISHLFNNFHGFDTSLDPYRRNKQRVEYKQNRQIHMQSHSPMLGIRLLSNILIKIIGFCMFHLHKFNQCHRWHLILTFKCKYTCRIITRTCTHDSLMHTQIGYLNIEISQHSIT